MDRTSALRLTARELLESTTTIIIIVTLYDSAIQTQFAQISFFPRSVGEVALRPRGVGEGREGVPNSPPAEQDRGTAPQPSSPPCRYFVIHKRP